jgi:hypothetical protein
VTENPEALLKGRISTVDLRVLTSLEKFILKFTFVAKQATLMRRSTVLNHPIQ